LQTVGTGAKDEKSPTGYAVGYQAPDFRILGTVYPDIDGDVGTLAEPGQGEVTPPLVPDTADLEPPSSPSVR
jgi:hypothetical protein